jgi:hypothetical protein
MWGNSCGSRVEKPIYELKTENLRNKASSLRILTTHEEKLNDLSEANLVLHGQIAELLRDNTVQNTQSADRMVRSYEKSTDVESKP